MLTNPNDIQLTQDDKQLLSMLVEESGKDLSEALREAVTAYLERSAFMVKPNGGIQTPDHEREQAFLRAAGAWADVDTDTLLEEIYTQRLHSTRPEPQL